VADSSHGRLRAEEGSIGSEHTVADDILYDLISIQHHATQRRRGVQLARG
jgi:hypothetical protein